MSDLDPRLAQANETLLRIAEGDLHSRTRPGHPGDAIDALLVGINMLAETLEEEQRLRKGAEAELEDERRAYHASPALLASVSPLGTVLRCNETLRQAVGRPIEAIVGGPLTALHPPHEHAAIQELLQDLGADQHPRPIELTLTQGERTLILDGRPVWDAQGDLDRIWLIYHDVSEERRLEHHLRHAQKMEAVGRLAGGVAHDFNNLLTVIQATVTLLLDDAPPESTLQKDLGDIDFAASRAAQLTRQLLAFSRQQLVKPVAIHINDVVDRLEGLLRRTMPEFTQLQVLLTPQVPIIRVDPLELEQVIVNLAVNARDAMPTGGVITIRTAAADGDDHPELGLDAGRYVVLTVSDTGHGIPQSQLERIFEPFFTTKPRGHGTGLGLATCYGIVRQAGGAIQCHSEVDRGTTFEVFLPAIESPTTARTPPSVSPPSEGARGRLLVVEDDPVVLRLEQRILVGAGYDVTSATSVAEARQQAAQQPTPFHLLLADAVLPDGFGVDLAKALQESGQVCRVLFVSGYSNTPIMQKGALQPGMDLLRKPFTPALLLSRVRELLAQGAADSPSPHPTEIR